PLGNPHGEELLGTVRSGKERYRPSRAVWPRARSRCRAAPPIIRISTAIATTTFLGIPDPEQPGFTPPPAAGSSHSSSLDPEPPRVLRSEEQEQRLSGLIYSYFRCSTLSSEASS